MHAHRTTQQVLTCLRGQIKVRLDDGEEVAHTTLNQNERIFVDKMVWDSQCFMTDDSILMSICSTSYDIDDYILDYQIFRKLTENKR